MTICAFRPLNDASIVSLTLALLIAFIQAISAFKADVVQPLTATRDAFSTANEHIRSGGALLGALGEELEEVVDFIQLVKDGHNDNATRVEGEEREDAVWLGSKLVEMFKDLKGQYILSLLVVSSTCGL